MRGQPQIRIGRRKTGGQATAPAESPYFGEPDPIVFGPKPTGLQPLEAEDVDPIEWPPRPALEVAPAAAFEEVVDEPELFATPALAPRPERRGAGPWPGL